VATASASRDGKSAFVFDTGWLVCNVDGVGKLGMAFPPIDRDNELRAATERGGVLFVVLAADNFHFMDEEEAHTPSTRLGRRPSGQPTGWWT
jgi:hypothetical protein